MTSILENIQADIYYCGEIFDSINGIYKIRLENNDVITAKKEFSLLIEPELQDIVKLYKYNGNYYINTIVDRQNDSLVIKLANNSTIDVENLSLNILNLNSVIEQAKSFFNLLDLNGAITTIKTQTLKIFSKSNENNHIETVNKFDRSYTYVNEFHELQAKNSRELIDENKIIKSNNVIIGAKDQVKIDGEMIHLA